MKTLQNKQIVVAITGGIAAYKSAYLVRQLQEKGAQVRVVMTAAATTFVTALTFQALTRSQVWVDGMVSEASDAMDHIALAKWADWIVVAPATANSLANLAAGKAADLLSTLCLASAAPLAVAPAMNQQMWAQASTQTNIQTLQDRGVLIWGPAEGIQACGDTGTGRMWEPERIVKALEAQCDVGILAGKRLLITAGPTRESIDPMRYLSNRSTGKMGYALAEMAIEMGAAVTLVSGPVGLEIPDRVSGLQVETAVQMRDTVLKALPMHDWMIATAAVADYRPASVSRHKIKKKNEVLQLALEPNPDILAEAALHADRPKLVVGFAAETEDLQHHALLKLDKKNLDAIVVNEIGQGIGVEVDENAVTVLWKSAKDIAQVHFPLAHKRTIARQLLEQLSTIMAAQQERK